MEALRAVNVSLLVKNLGDGERGVLTSRLLTMFWKMLDSKMQRRLDDAVASYNHAHPMAAAAAVVAVSP